MGLSLPEVTVSIFSVSSPSAGTLISKSVRFALLGGLAAFSLLGATGCYARVRAHPTVVATYQEPVYEEPVVYVQSAPVVDIESHPRVYYRGSYVYYVDGRWYAPSRRGWVYYRSEPRDLVRYRVDFERHPRVTTRVTTRVEAPRIHVPAPRVEAHVEAHGSVQAGAGAHRDSHPAKPVKRKDH